VCGFGVVGPLLWPDVTNLRKFLVFELDEVEVWFVAERRDNSRVALQHRMVLSFGDEYAYQIAAWYWVAALT
jgi:hypothetical protein